VELIEIQQFFSNSITDVVDAVGDIGDKISDFLDNTGKYCIEVLDAGINSFTNFVNFSMGLLTEDLGNSSFSAFWNVIDKVTSVLGIVASTLLIILFLINLCTDTWDNRHDLDMWDIIKMVVKAIVSVILVNNAIVIVKAIFNMGSALAGIIFLDGAEKSIELSSNTQLLLSTGVSGFKGLLVFLVCMIVAIAIMVCGITVAMEVLQRVFKIYVLVPFSTLTFTSFVMGNGNRGNEVFRSYLKTVINTAAEALIIMVCVNFCYALLGNAEIMNELIGLDSTNIESVKIEINDIDDYDALMICLNNEYSDYVDSDKVEQMSSKIPARTEWGAVVLTDPKTHNSEQNGASLSSGSNSFSNLQRSAVREKLKNGSLNVYLCPAISWKELLIICLSVLFPCVLCSGAVKSAGQYASMIFGH
jgi:hypothetical protein